MFLLFTDYLTVEKESYGLEIYRRMKNLFNFSKKRNFLGTHYFYALTVYNIKTIRTTMRPDENRGKRVIRRKRGHYLLVRNHLE